MLEPGQVLYVPKHWWHYVECESTAISVNTWIELVSQNKIQSDLHLSNNWKFIDLSLLDNLLGIFWSCIPFVLKPITPVLGGIVSMSFFVFIVLILIFPSLWFFS